MESPLPRRISYGGNHEIVADIKGAGAGSVIVR